MVASRAGAPARGRDRRDSSASSPEYGTRFATGASLPPNAPSEDETSTSRPGGDTGHVELVLRDLEWFMRAPPPYVRVSARWWGDDLVADAARPWVGLDSARDADATFVFPVVAKPAGFARYCRDAAMLALEFADGRTGRVAAVASVDVARLDLGRPVLGARALRTRGGATVGSVRVEMRVDFRPDRVSSFERNERLAEAECAETNAGSDTASSENVFDDDVEGDAERVDADENGASPTKTASAAEGSRRAPRLGTKRNVSPETSRRLDAARARSRANAELAERKRNARRRRKEKKERHAPRDAVEACEMLRREIDAALALDGAEAGRMIDEEIARKTFDDGPGLKLYDAWVRSAASLDLGSLVGLAKEGENDGQTSVRSSGETTRSERDAATAWLGGTEDDPDGETNADDAAACAEEALVCALARFADEKESDETETETKTENAPAADADTERCIASAAATALADAQLDDVDGPPPDPDIELRLTLHDGSVRALASSVKNEPEPETENVLVVIVKGGHPFPAGELARVALGGVGARYAGTARVALPSAAADAIVDPAKKTPVMALEVWDPLDLVAARPRRNKSVKTGTSLPETRRRSDDADDDADAAHIDAADVSFAALFGDFKRADPRAVRGVVAVGLDALANDVRRARRRAAENRRWGLVELEASTAYNRPCFDGVDGVSTVSTNDPRVSFDGSPLNRVFEVRGVFDGATHGFLGVEAGVVNARVRAQRH